MSEDLIAKAEMALPDVQSSADNRHIPIQRVGVKGVSFPITVAAENGPQQTVASVNMYVSLPAGQKGTHMSRFFQLLDETRKPLDKTVLEDLMQRMLRSLQAQGGSIEIRFPFFIRKAATISGLSSLMSYEAGYTITSEDGACTLTETVRVPVTSLCPCSKEISRYGAHNQRSIIAIDAVCQNPLPLESLIRIAEKGASCELWSLLKREDEKFVTEFAYDHAKFVEDISRDVATELNKNPCIAAYRLEVENFESIHNHSAFARISSGNLP